MMAYITMLAIAFLWIAFVFIKPMVVNKWHWFWFRYHSKRIRIMGESPAWSLDYNHHGLRASYHLERI